MFPIKTITDSPFIKEVQLPDCIWGVKFQQNPDPTCSSYYLIKCSLDYKKFSEREYFPFMTEKEAFDALDKICAPSRIVKLRVTKELSTTILEQVAAKVKNLLESSAVEPEEYTPDEQGLSALSNLLLTAALQDIVAKRLHIASDKTRKELKNLENF
jgi:hypothetical protein